MQRASGRLVSLFNVALAAVQLLIFLPDVLAGRAVEFLRLGDGVPLLRADGLALTAGVAWCIAALSAGSDGPRGYVVTLGVLLAAYAREPWVLLAAVEVAVLALYFTRGAASRSSVYAHLAGVPLLAAVAAGSVLPFAPPAGGVASPWPLPVALALVLFSVGRAYFLPLLGRPTSTAYLLALWLAFVPGKGLMAAPWDAWGVWLFALLALSLLAAQAVRSALYADLPGGILRPFLPAALLGFALAPASPLAAAGGVAFTLAGLFSFAASSGPPIAYLASVPAAWLVSQGALDAGYGIVPALLVPSLFLLFQLGNRRHTSTARGTLDVWRVALVAAAVVPFAVAGLALRPAVRSMAGGVGALVTLGGDPGLGLQVRSQEVVSAALPLTGAALAFLLAFAVLRWLRRLAALLSRDGKTG